MKKLHLPLLAFLFFAAQWATAQPLSAELRPYQGKPTIFINGQPESPMFYALTDVPGGRWSWEEVPQHNLLNFCEAGIHLFQLDIFWEHIEPAPGQFSLDIAKHQVQGALAACPDAAVVFRFHLNPPAWWLAKNPDELVAYEPGTPAQPFEPLHLSRIVQDDAGLPVRASFASQKWREDGGAMLARFCKEFSKTKEGERLIGIHVAAGVYGEWHQWGFIEHEADFSAAMERHLKNWVREKYKTDSMLMHKGYYIRTVIDSVCVPKPIERNTSSLSLMRMPTENRIVDYYRCQHELVADNILFFCKTVKDNWPRPILTGAFYGYFFSMFNRQAAGGHLELQRVLASPWIDYLSGPQVYYPDDGYDPGEPYRSRSLVRSITLHGKLWLDEYDQQPRRTFPVLNGKDNTENYRRNVQENIAAIERNVLSPLTKGAGLWFYDFGPSGMNLHRGNEHDIQSGTIGYWDHPDYLRSIKRLKTLADSLLHRPWQTGADVLLVYDTEIFYYLKSTKQDSCPITSQVVDWLPLALCYGGYAWDAVHLDDLDTIDLSPYRAVIFANTWDITTEELYNVIWKRVNQEKRHVFWIYQPGFVGGSPAKVLGVVGFPLKWYHVNSNAIVSNDSTLPRQVAWGDYFPLYHVDDSKAIPYAYYEVEGNYVAIGRKEKETYTSWYLGIPPIDARWWRQLLADSGAHIYTDDGVVYAGGGLLVFHTKTGGEQKIKLKNGKEVLVKMPVGAGTVALDAQTGEVVLE